MTRHLFSRTLLGAAGGLLLVIGVSIMADPQGFAAGNGVTSGIDASLASELRAPSGLLIGSGVCILISIARTHLLTPALRLASAIYGSYGLSRLFGVMADGWPSPALNQAMGLELVVGALCGIAAYRLHEACGETKASNTLAGDTA